MNYSEFVIEESKKGVECSKINLSDEDVLFQQYNVLKIHIIYSLFFRNIWVQAGNKDI